jgi:hypothetical protein
VLKGRSNGQTAYVNGENKGGSGNMGNFTVYVNPYLVLRSGGYTKHYYIEGQRIVSKLGGGMDNNGKGPLKAGEGRVDYNGKQQKIRDGIVKNLKFLGLDGAILTAGKSGKVPQVSSIPKHKVEEKQIRKLSSTSTILIIWEVPVTSQTLPAKSTSTWSTLLSERHL